MIENINDPYMLGWFRARNDETADCPFDEGTEESVKFWEGYQQGVYGLSV